jgi:hypothetical protein
MLGANVRIYRLTLGAGRLVPVSWFFRDESGGPLFVFMGFLCVPRPKEALASMPPLG